MAAKKCYTVREHLRCPKGATRPPAPRKKTVTKAPSAKQRAQARMLEGLKEVYKRRPTASVTGVSPPPNREVHAVRAAPPAKPAPMLVKSKKKRITPMLVSGPSSTPRAAFGSETAKEKRDRKEREHEKKIEEAYDVIRKSGREKTDKWGIAPSFVRDLERKTILREPAMQKRLKRGLALSRKIRGDLA